MLGPQWSTTDSSVCAVTALVFTEKLGVLPERVFESMFNDRLVAKGTIIAMVTEIFKQYMAITDGNVEDLVTLLAKAKVSNRLLDYFPPGQQTEAAFKSHFEKEGLDKLVRRLPPYSFTLTSKLSMHVLLFAFVSLLEVLWEASTLRVTAG